MRKYDRLAKCIKCGGNHIVTTYKPGYNAISWRSWSTLEYPVHEVLVRQCRTCGYSWEELPLDSKEEKDG